MLVSFKQIAATMSNMLDSLCAQLKCEYAKAPAEQNDLIQPAHTLPNQETVHRTVHRVRTNHSFTSE